MPLFQFVFVLLGCISFSTAVLSINTCHRLKEIYEEVPVVIDFSTRDICRSELELLQCDLMSKLVLENSRSKITELRVKNNCYENEGLLEPAPLEDRCSLIEELPSKSIKLITSIFPGTAQKELAKEFGASIANSLVVMLAPLHSQARCDQFV